MSETPTIESTEAKEEAPRNLSLLAQEAFGPQYTGEHVEEAKSEEPVEQKANGEPPKEGEIEETKVERTEGEPGESEETESSESEEIPISSLPELIEHQEWDPEWVDTLKVPVKVDGQPAEAALSDLVANYQMNAAADNRLEKAKALVESHTQEFQQKSEALEGQFATAAKLIESAETLLNADVKSIDLGALRESDPAEYAAKVAETSERRKAIDDMKREAAESYQTAAQEQQKQHQEQLGQRLQAEQELLLDKLPEWRDANTAKEEQAKLSRFLIETGFTEQDIATASDHRLILLARSAMLFNESQSKVDVAKKKVAKVPKVMTPGTPKPKEAIGREKRDKLKSKLRKTKRVDHQMDVAVELLKAKRGG